MRQQDIEFISEGYRKAFKDLGEGRNTYYIPYDNVLSTTDSFGKITFKWDEDIRIPIDVTFEKDARTDTDLAPFWTGRINATVRLISTQLKSENIILKLRDAIDVEIDGVTQRFVITGFPKDPVMFRIFTKVNVTDIEHAFKGQ